MKQHIFFLLNLLLIGFVCWGNYQYLSPGGPDLKALCSSGFVVLGLVNLLYALLCRRGRVYCLVMAAGLLLAMLGDLFVSRQFALGAALFAVGHLCYTAAFCVADRFRWPDLLIWGGIFAAAAAFLLLWPNLRFTNPLYRNICLAYALIISLMTGKAISGFIRAPRLLTGLLMAGSVLFFLSDLMLVLNWFAFQGRWASLACLATYYPAQCLLAHGGYHAVSQTE